MRILAGAGLISLLITVVIIASLFNSQFKSLGFLSGTKGPQTANQKSTITNQNPLEAANSIKAQADLRAVATRLEVYFSENDTYPQTLQEVDLEGLDPSSFSYTYCSQTHVIIRSGSQSLILKEGSQSFFDSSATC